MIGKITCLILICTYCSMATAQKTRIYYDYNWNPSSQEAAFYFGELEKNDTGWFRADYSAKSGQLLKHGFYKDASCTTKHGLFEYFFGTGEISGRELYHNNQKTGTHLSVYPNKMISDSFQFKTDIPYGLCSSWYPSGNPRTEMQLDTLGNGSGVVVGFFDNGVVSFKGKLAKGLRKTGNWFYYHPNGQRASVLQYGTADSLLTELKPQIKYDIYEYAYYDSTVEYANAICYDTNGVVQTHCEISSNKPEYSGGIKAWVNYLSGQLPDIMNKPGNPKKTTIYIAYFMVNPDGNPSGIMLDNTVNKGFDDEITGVFKRSKKWKPVLHNNRIIPFLNKQSLTLSYSF